MIFEWFKNLKYDMIKTKMAHKAIVSLLNPVHQKATEGINKQAIAVYFVSVFRIELIKRKNRHETQVEITEKKRFRVM